MEGRGFEFRYGQQIFIFFKSVQTDFGDPVLPSLLFSGYPGFFPGDKAFGERK